MVSGKRDLFGGNLRFLFSSHTQSKTESFFLSQRSAGYGTVKAGPLLESLKFKKRTTYFSLLGPSLVINSQGGTALIALGCPERSIRQPRSLKRHQDRPST